MGYIVTTTNGELYHHGILGQKWGVRRYQNPDGSLTSAGRKRYSVTGLIKDKYNGRVSKLESKYISKGMTKEQANIAARKRAKAEAFTVGVLSVTAAALVAYGANKYYQENVDKFINSNSTLKRIEADGNKDVHNVFYAAANKHDEKRYAGLYAKTINSRGNDVFQKTIKTTGKIKIASNKNAKKALEELIDDKNNKEKMIKLVDRYGPHFIGRGDLDDIKQQINSGKIDKRTYDFFNRALPMSREHEITKDFYALLKEKGYGAIQDVNDKKYSGYNAKNPLIVFDKGKTVVKAVEKLSVEQIRKNYNAEDVKLYKEVMTKQYVKGILPQVVGYGAVGTASVYAGTISQNEVVSNYMKAHPNSKLSYDEIIKNYYTTY